MHHSILTATESVQLSKCTTCCKLYHCCWCTHFKPARLGALKKHINAHIRTALTFEDLCIIRCGLECRAAAHYHCPWCENTLLRADAMKKHLLNCKLQSHSPSPAMHIGQSPIPVIHIGQSPIPVIHIGQSPIPAMHIGQSPSPAMHIGQSPSPAMHIGQSPSPSGQLFSPPQSANPAMHSGQSPSPAMHSGQSPSPAMQLFSPPQSANPAMHSGQSPSPAMHSGQSTSSSGELFSPQSPSPAMHSGQSPSPAMHSGQSTSPAMHSSGQVLSSALPSSSGQAPSPTDPSTHSSAANSKVQCPHCSRLMYRKNLRLHIARTHQNTSKTYKDITATSHLAGVCVDTKNGISAVQRTARGFSTPIHVQRKCWGEIQKTRCELDECLNQLQLAQQSGLPYDLCEHIRSLDYCDRIATEEPLDMSILDKMVASQFFGEGKKATCIKRQQDALGGGVPFSVLVELGHSSRHICLSIHEPEVTQHSKLGRIMVTYNKADKTWHCPCANPLMSCAHQNIAKWHLFQFNGELFITTTPPSSPTKQKEIIKEESECDPPPKDLRRMTEYILSRKKIPFNLPEEVILKRPTEYPTYLYPAETKCLLCPDQPQLESPVEITRKAKIVTMSGIIANVSTFTRRCAVCQMFYRYQEWEHGLHNFNDHILLSLELCLYLRHNLQNHVSVSRVINSLESLRKVSFPPRDTMLHAYCHFETLSDIDYSYSCVACGYHPPVVIMDLHNKGIFTMAVSEVKDPSDDYNGEQNITEFWNSVEMDLICRGFVPSHAKNPLAVHSNYEHWAPWIGQQTRKSDIVLNTEYEKVSSVQSGVEAELQSITEDRLVDELMKQKDGIVRKLCKECKVDDTGSRIDLILRLRNAMKSRQTYDKVFQQIWGASGGWSVILCPHGVVYSVKFNPRAESPRDLLFSWKHFPNVVMYDFARGLATHANQQRKSSSLPFQPYDRRLTEPTADNHEAAKKKKLTVSHPWLLNKNNSDPNAHPVPELQGSLNSRVAEQFFRRMKKNDYFLNNMAPSTHMFVMRNIIQHHNTETNAKLQTHRSRPHLH